MQAIWVRAVCSLDGDRRVAEEAAADLTTRYAEPHRRYHNTAHVQAVIRDSGLLADELTLPAGDRACLIIAAGAHDVIYNAQPGHDEQNSAAWARHWLHHANVSDPHIARIETLILTTLTHTAPPHDLTAHALLDADLAILGTDPTTYDRYRTAVRAEYNAIDDQTWRTGRTEILSNLLARQPLYATAYAQRHWETTARNNITRELDTLTDR